jgi:hypothetical protein
MLPSNATLTEAASGLVFPATELGPLVGGTPVVPISATDYSLNGSEAGQMLYFTSMTAITLVVPSDLTVDFPINTSIIVVQGGSGAILFSPADDTVTLNSFNDATQTGGQFSGASLVKTAANTWLLSGNLVTV